MTSFCHGLMAERKGFEPLRALGALHDFQSCALDQLSHLSIRILHCVHVVRVTGLEPVRRNTRPSNVPVCQFQHTRIF